LPVCALLYASTRFLHEANPIWRLTSLLWTLEVIGLTLLTVHLVLGVSAQRTSDFGFRTSDFTFPICFFVVAVPWPSGLESLLVQSLMRANVAATVELLGLFGIPALQHGNVIEVGTGLVGIEEACSGIRSLQATLMLSLFLGEVCRLTVRRRLGLVGLGFVLAFAFNLGRTLLLTGIASARGVGAVASWHDPAGVTILVACFLSLWLIARALEKAESRKPKAEGTGHRTADRGHPPSYIFHLRSVSTALAAWLVLVEGGTELWYRLHERGVRDHAKWSVEWPDSQAVSQVVEVPPSIRGQFRYDEAMERRWQDANGGDWQLYYFRWFPARSLSKRVEIQLAKTHGPETCLPAVGMSLRSSLGIITVPIAGMELAMQQYVFNAEGRPLHVFYGIYEDPTGSAVLANRRQNAASRIKAALAGSRNYGQRFLEVAVYGYEKPDDAKAALVRELGKVIKIEK
jgi:exosortase